MPFKSKSKRKSYGKAWKKNNKAKQKNYNKVWKDKLKLWYSNYKNSSKCAICGESRSVILESHHIFPKEKSFCLCEGIQKGVSIRRLEQEASKCIVLCCSHHRLYHLGAFNDEEQIVWDYKLKQFMESRSTENVPKKSKQKPTPEAPSTSLSQKPVVSVTKNTRPKKKKKFYEPFLLNPNLEYEEEPVLAVLQ